MLWYAVNSCSQLCFALEYTGSMCLISIPYQAMLTLSYTLKESKYSTTCILVTTCILKTMHLFFVCVFYSVKKQVSNAQIAYSHLLIRKNSV